jgi:hypothetical protein
MADICPVCGEPHGKEPPNTPQVTRPHPAPAPAPVAELSPADDILQEIDELEESEDLDAVVESLVGPEDDVEDDVVEEEAVEEEPEPEAVAVDRSYLTFKSLRAEATERGITVPFGATKATLLAILSEDDAK